MNKHRKKKKSSISTTGRLIAVGCIILIAAGIWLSMRSNAGTSASSAEVETSADPEVTGTVSSGAQVPHYPALETVELPEALASQIKEYTGFTISFNKDNGTPNYVVWELLGDEVQTEMGRSNNFWSDRDLEGCPTTKDYTHSGYDRGHMCPAADQKWSAQAMEDCFVMANICPQDHKLNTGAWNTLENKERQWAKRDSALMIVAGPIYDKADKTRIGKAGVRVPGAFFKVLLAPYVEEPRGIAFVYPNMTAPGNMQDYAMSIDELEKMLGYDFFPTLPDEIEEKVEATYSFKDWNSSTRK